MAKRQDGLYTRAETPWVKVKNPAYSQGEDSLAKIVRARSEHAADAATDRLLRAWIAADPIRGDVRVTITGHTASNGGRRSQLTRIPAKSPVACTRPSDHRRVLKAAYRLPGDNASVIRQKTLPGRGDTKTQ